MPIADGEYVALIPFPTASVNKNALNQPFELQVTLTFTYHFDFFIKFVIKVWISLIVCFFAVIIAWTSINIVLVRVKTSKQFESQRSSILTATTYVTGVILSQGNEIMSNVNRVNLNTSQIGGYCFNKRLAIRLVAGVWCFTAFVISPAYSGNLKSFLMAPIIKPLISTIEDIPGIEGLEVVSDRGKGLDSSVQSWVNTVSFKFSY